MHQPAAENKVQNLKQPVSKVIGEGPEATHATVSDFRPEGIIQRRLIALANSRMQTVTVQRVSPHDLHENDINAFDALIQNIRDNCANIDWDWGHIEDRHTVEGGAEEGEILENAPDPDTAYFETVDQETIGNLVITAIQNGARRWEEDRDVVWFVHDFGRHIGGYPDGTSATRLRVYINTSAMQDETDTGNAYITSAFPLA